MSLNTWNDGLDGLNLSGKVSEQSEEQREQAAAALAGIAKTQKDEKKAQKYDLWLSELIKRLLKNSVYDHIITQLVPLLTARCPSHLLLGYLLPIADDYMDEVRAYLGLPKTPLSTPNTTKERKPYSEPLAPELARHLNTWMETLKGCLTIDPSQTSIHRINSMINSTYEEWLSKLAAHVIAHFLYDRGIDISPQDAHRVAKGITKKMLLINQGIQVDTFFTEDPSV